MLASPIDAWHALLRPDVELSAAHAADLLERMRAARLTFGDRPLCPFIRPFFIEEADVERVRLVAERIAGLGERMAAAALDQPALLAQFGLHDAEERLVRLDPGYARASTASRLDAFLLPDSLQFAEYNAESPAGFGYSETLSTVFAALPVMRRFREQFEVRSFAVMDAMLDALLASYRDWGGRASPPVMAIVDFRGVPTWSEFEILQARFEASGIPTLVLEPRELTFDGQSLTGGGRRIDLVYRRALVNDVLAHPEESAALVDAYAARAVCMANTFRCKIPHKKTFFAVLTDPRNDYLFSEEDRAVIRRHVPWTRVVRDVRTTTWTGGKVDLLEHVRGNREGFVLKPADEYGGAGVTLGWETSEADWDAALARALADEESCWIAQERIQVRREVFPRYLPGGGAEMTSMLVDFAPYLFRGRLAGFLARLSATGLANVTSGGGQTPVFAVKRK
jgi:uncharacterized circularly permuted ATP-grasp superfamily protein